MRKIVVLPLSPYVDTNSPKIDEAFSKLGVSKWRMMWNRSAINKIFERFENGEITSATFRNEMRDFFSD